MSGAPETRYAETLPATWLAARMAVDPAYIDGMRRGGELIAVKAPGSSEWRYPAWQFENGRPRAVVARIVATAKEHDLDDAQLFALFTTPLGLRDGGRTLVDLVREGRDDEVVAAIRGSS